jgi:hypothetical protein
MAQREAMCVILAEHRPGWQTSAALTESPRRRGCGCVTAGVIYTSNSCLQPCMIYVVAILYCQGLFRREPQLSGTVEVNWGKVRVGYTIGGQHLVLRTNNNNNNDNIRFACSAVQFIK